MTDLPVYTALRVVSADKRGSSRPVVIETKAGYFLTKLRGAAQGTPALIAEIVVASLAEALGLWVPCRSLILIDDTTQSDVHDDEFEDLFAASSGLNLGLQYLAGATDIRADEAEAIADEVACSILWLDAWVLNCDRTARNPNLMVHQDQLWLIDHGAALPFQYDWSKVSEASPRTTEYAVDRHIFGNRADNLLDWDNRLAARLSVENLQNTVAQIPEAFLKPLLPGAPAAAIERRRQAYAAFLWKRLKFPRPFM
ncbi:hypothetical protein PN498_01020 [Oscillatoria sp. CS-180]|uniref:HipA family kinase n=1 Tax=Oscillatoria sp. CS-180 TaxID=3021720 RepID=UPI00232DA643|nr:HipA family kinase [Oscillatoria sp. CS-180]MDB9524555.1 hypothetical protein [Oscillatoria sp. CS-180]